MSISPKPLIPGVSMTYPPPSSGYIVENVVVWRPLPWLSDTAPVRMSRPGDTVPTSVDFPTPELPDSRVVHPLISSFTRPMPVPSNDDTSTTSYPALR